MYRPMHVCNIYLNVRRIQADRLFTKIILAEVGSIVQTAERLVTGRRKLSFTRKS